MIYHFYCSNFNKSAISLSSSSSSSSTSIACSLISDLTYYYYYWAFLTLGGGPLALVANDFGICYYWTPILLS